MKATTLHPFVAALILLAGCGAPPDTTELLPADPRAILQSNLSHGFGESPFDSPLVTDSAAAAVLVRARHCSPRESLARQSEASDRTEQRIDELLSASLLVTRGEEICTSFPVLIGRDQAEYARVTSSAAADALAAMSDDLATLLDRIDSRGWSDWQYHFVWSQLFDSQFAWAAMTERDLVPPLARLIAWSIYPDHPFRSGTNYFPDTELRDHWLMVTWRPDAANTIAALAPWWDELFEAALYGDSLPNAVRDTLTRLGLADSTGALRLPVLAAGDPLLELLDSAATRYIAFLDRRLPLDSLVDVTGVDRQHTFAMAYHDTSWGILERLVGEGRLDVPPPLRRAAGGAASEMRGVAAIVPAEPRFMRLIRDALGGL